jgi:hypothetical protein
MARPDRLLQAVTLAVRLRSPTLQRLLQMLRRPQPGWMGRAGASAKFALGRLTRPNTPKVQLAVTARCSRTVRRLSSVSMCNFAAARTPGVCLSIPKTG